MRLLIFILVFCEFMIGAMLTRYFGFWPTFAFYFGPTVLGIPFFAFQNRMIWRNMQRELALGRTPDRSMLNAVSKFLGTIFLLLPSVFWRILSLILLFPISRYFFITFAQTWLAQKVAQGAFRVMNGGRGFGSGNARFYYNVSTDGQPQAPREERDAKIIDVDPLPLPGPKKPGEFDN